MFVALRSILGCDCPWGHFPYTDQGDILQKNCSPQFEKQRGGKPVSYKHKKNRTNMTEQTMSGASTIERGS